MLCDAQSISRISSIDVKPLEAVVDEIPLVSELQDCKHCSGETCFLLDGLPCALVVSTVMPGVALKICPSGV